MGAVSSSHAPCRLLEVKVTMPLGRLVSPSHRAGALDSRAAALVPAGVLCVPQRLANSCPSHSQLPQHLPYSDFRILAESSYSQDLERYGHMMT
jgi:hypothetical protein